MKKLFKNKKGFTLMEMLIVVAIIVILVAISLPVFSGQLNKAKKAKNDANERAAKAVGVAEYLSGTKEGGNSYWYNAVDGILLDAGSAKPEAYSEAVDSVTKDQAIVVTISTDGTVTTKWQ